jgi:hypothetical protein
MSLVFHHSHRFYWLWIGIKQDGKKERSFSNFFALQNPELLKKVPIITTEEFLRREGGKDGQFPMPNENRTKLLNVQDSCQYRMKSAFAANYPIG